MLSYVLVRYGLLATSRVTVLPEGCLEDKTLLESLLLGTYRSLLCLY